MHYSTLLLAASALVPEVAAKSPYCYKYSTNLKFWPRNVKDYMMEGEIFLNWDKVCTIKIKDLNQPYHWFDCNTPYGKMYGIKAATAKGDDGSNQIRRVAIEDKYTPIILNLEQTVGKGDPQSLYTVYEASSRCVDPDNPKA